jgi:hypothetical protein
MRGRSDFRAGFVNGTSFGIIIESPTGHKTPSILPLPATNLKAPATESPNRTPALLRESPMAQSFYLREQADRCRRLARGTNDVVTQERLLKLAAEYEAQADVRDTADRDVPALRRAGHEDDDD